MPDEDVEDIEYEEPGPDDYVKTACGKLGSKTCVGIVEDKFLGEYDDDVTADEAICENMNQKKLWTTVWNLSDHGNLEVDTEFKCEQDSGDN